MKAWAALFGLLPAPAMAQAYQCTLPQTLASVAPIKPDGAPRKTPVAGYTLTASWSPDYCKTSGDTRSMQCSGTNGRFGFILHGLWPEGRRDPPPQWCRSAPPPPPALLRRHLCLTPSPQLLAHEWAKHGTCMTRRPETFFQVSAVLWESIHWPDADALSQKDGLTAGDLRDEFLALNKGWRREAVGLNINPTGWLREIRLCYDKRFRPARCPPERFGPSDATMLKIWRGL